MLNLNENIPIPVKSSPAAENFLTLPLHTIAARRAAEIFNVETANGLTNQEAALRLLTSGANTLELDNRRAWWRLFLRQFSSIVIWLLAFAAAFSAFHSKRIGNQFFVTQVLLASSALRALIVLVRTIALRSVRKRRAPEGRRSAGRCCT